MTTKRPTKKAPAEAGADRQRDIREHQFQRVLQWALSQPHAELATHLAGLVMISRSDRKTLRKVVAQFNLLADHADGLDEDVSELWNDLTEQKQKRQEGASARWANDPSQAAKAAAIELWPSAKQHGWSATQFHRAIVDKGHSTPFDTARKWMTKLRSTGTC